VPLSDSLFLVSTFFSAPNWKGQNGAASASSVVRGALDAASKRSFPVKLIVIMKRQAEDLLLGNTDNQKGKEALQFILSLANERNDVDQIKKGCYFWIIRGTDSNLVVGIKNSAFPKPKM